MIPKFNNSPSPSWMSSRNARHAPSAPSFSTGKHSHARRRPDFPGPTPAGAIPEIGLPSAHIRSGLSGIGETVEIGGTDSASRRNSAFPSTPIIPCADRHWAVPADFPLSPDYEYNRDSRSENEAGQKRSLTIGIALGGGGAKGYAHIGILRVLEERGIVPAWYPEPAWAR